MRARTVFNDVMLDRHVSTTAALKSRRAQPQPRRLSQPPRWAGSDVASPLFDITHLGDDMNGAERNDLLTPAEVAERFRVNPKTVTRWAQAGKISAVRTLGGHRRFRRSEIEAQLRSDDPVEV